MNYTELRLKLTRFFRKYGKIIFIVLLIWLAIVIINMWLKNRTVEPTPTTTYEPHVSVMDSTSSTPKSMQTSIETLIENYVTYCNEGDYEHAFNMISDDCRSYEFEDSPSKFIDHVFTKMPTDCSYAIQDYSNMSISAGTVYIYEVKYTQDLLATGLTNSDYVYTTEKFSFIKDSDGNIQMGIGNYIYHTAIQSVSENDYLKVDVVDKLVNYSIETYQVKFTNRSEYTVVIADGQGTEEIDLQLPNEVRTEKSGATIVLAPGESTTKELTFTKFADDGDTSQNLIFGSVRVMETYSGVTDDVSEETIQSEIDNAIAKFSVTISVAE